MKTKTVNNVIVKSLITLIEGYNSASSPDDVKRAKSIYKYLIGQTIRQYEVGDDHKHVSEKAKALWDSLSSSCVFDYGYRDRVVTDKVTVPFTLNKYKGASRTPAAGALNVAPNGSITFNDVFHIDHMIPVYEIFKELIALTTLNENNVKRVLDSMHLCWILKEEDKKLGRTANREGGFDAIRDTLYKNAGITILANTYTV